MIIKEEIEIKAPLAVVWEVFSHLEDWKFWNTVCEDCCLIEGIEMVENACFAFTLRPYAFPLRITPKILCCDPGREVVWAGSRLGVHAEHRFLFRQKDDRVVLTSIEKFKGFMFQISRLIGVPRKLHRLTIELLTSVKNRAESGICRISSQ